MTDLVEDFLVKELERGVRHTQNSLQDARSAVGGNASRDGVRMAVNALQSLGRVVRAPLPEKPRSGPREYLHPTKAGAPGGARSSDESDPRSDEKNYKVGARPNSVGGRLEPPKMRGRRHQHGKKVYSLLTDGTGSPMETGGF